MTISTRTPSCPARPWPIEQVDAALDEISRRRTRLMATPATPWRAAQLAELADTEATWWEAVSERCATRVHWRAALAAREHAQHTARHWRAHAHHPPRPAAPPAEGEVA
jgi:hypothetical protein